MKIGVANPLFSKGAVMVLETTQGLHPNKGFFVCSMFFSEYEMPQMQCKNRGLPTSCIKLLLAY